MATTIIENTTPDRFAQASPTETETEAEAEAEAESAAAAFFSALVRDVPRPYRLRESDPQRAIRGLLKRLGSPQRGLRAVHITGSKGKGSTALLLESVLLAAGCRVGVFSSPHLQRWNERFRLDGRQVTNAELDAAVEALRGPVGELGDDPHGADAPGFFDALTAAALWLFARAGVDYAIIEAGVGGRLDATTIVEPALCCITAVELEHVDKLGHSLAAIASEKAGIIKPGVAVIAGGLPAEARAVISARAQMLSAPLLLAGRDFDYHTLRLDAAGGRFRLRSGGRELLIELPLLGRAAIANAALAAVCAQRLPGADLDPTLLGKGLAQARLPGRCELLRADPWRLVDGAHTLRSAAALREVVDLLPARGRHWVLSFGPDKNPLQLCAALLRPGDRATLTRADPLRSAAVESYAERCQSAVQRVDWRRQPEPRLALDEAASGQRPGELLCATGSVYLAGLARQRWR